MYQAPVNISGEKDFTSASDLGTGQEPSSCRCGTHCNTASGSGVGEIHEGMDWGASYGKEMVAGVREGEVQERKMGRREG